MRRRFTFFLLFLLGMHFFNQRLSASIGNGNGFLQLPVEVNHYSLGYAANVQNVAALMYNPAAHAENPFENKTPTQFLLTFQGFEDDMALYNGMLSRYLGKKIGSLGAAIVFFDYGSFANNDELGQALGNISAYDMQLALNYARSLPQNYALGVNLKFLSSKIASYSASNFAMDLSGQKKILLFNNPMHIMISVLNLGPATRFIDSQTPLPALALFSASYSFQSFLRNSIIRNLDVILSPQFQFSFQGDFSFGSSVSLQYHLYQTSFFCNGKFEVASLENNWSIGMGVTARLGSNQVGLSSLLNANGYGKTPAMSLLYTHLQEQQKKSVFHELMPPKEWAEIRKDKSLTQNIVSVHTESGEVYEGVIAELDDSSLRIKIISAKIRKENILKMEDLKQLNERGEMVVIENQEMVITLKDGSQLKGKMEQVGDKFYLKGNSFFGKDFELNMGQVDKVAKIKRIEVITKDNRKFVGNLAETSENFIAIEGISDPKENQKLQKEDVYNIINGTNTLKNIDNPDPKYLDKK